MILKIALVNHAMRWCIKLAKISFYELILQDW